ncbi:MAG: hypothetical protein JETCAE03_35020 [Ignavibacteriaceae bacterium]|jgi:hypothetical protein|nr:MAG: hypothetical protein JETCAE03_35020 [Ignavibacteriaceae bacterium]
MQTIKMISVCNKACDFYETHKNISGCTHQQAVINSPDDRIIEMVNKATSMRRFNEVDEMFKKFDGGFPAWCPLAREIQKVKTELTESL